MRFLKIIFYFVLSGIALVSVLPHLFPDYWLTDIFSHFKLQYLVILIFFLLPFALYHYKKRIIPGAIILILIIWNAKFIVPLYFQNETIVENNGDSLSLLSVNLLASNTNYTEAIDLVKKKDPDILVISELSVEWDAQLKELYAIFPYRKMYTQNNNFGIGILSKFPMSAEVTDLGKGFPPSILAQIEFKTQTLSILATHPFPPVSQQKFELRNSQLEEIAKLSKVRAGNFILAGDINTSSYSLHFRNLIQNGNLKDSRRGFGIASSWPSNILPMRTTLDHILYKGKMNVLTRTTEAGIGSDHLPVYIRLSL